jgi:hypothetical protein
MPKSDYIPHSDSDLLLWHDHFKADAVFLLRGVDGEMGVGIHPRHYHTGSDL